MLNDGLPHSLVLQALPSAVGSIVAYVFGWSRRLKTLPPQDDDKDKNDNDNDNDNDDDDDDIGHYDRLTVPGMRSIGRDAIGRTALYRALVRGRVREADRILASIEGDVLVRAIADRMTLSAIVARDRAAALFLVTRHAARAGTDMCAIFTDPRMCDARAGGSAAAGVIDP
ncbi:MAG TPA: hypothetical protein VIO38_16190, partial [Rariglobus sp.]